MSCRPLSLHVFGRGYFFGLCRQGVIVKSFEYKNDMFRTVFEWLCEGDSCTFFFYGTQKRFDEKKATGIITIERKKGVNDGI